MWFSSIIISSLAASSALAFILPPHLTNKTEVKGFDISHPQTSAFWSCAKKAGYGRVAIRGYQQLCGSGGGVDSHFVESYHAATAAGLSVDAYLFPCAGTHPNGVACKPVKTQLQEFLHAISSNNLKIDRYWFDIEPTKKGKDGNPCNGWDFGKQANLALAKEWVAAIKASGRNWGIYANGNQWDGMFPTRTTDVASDLPLWAVQADSTPGVSTVHTFMGGWTKAYAKQYKLDTKTPECGGGVDLDSFLA